MKVYMKDVKVVKTNRISDTVVFMAAYSVDKISKHVPRIRKKKAKDILSAHHVAAIISTDSILTQNGRFSYTEEHNHVKQETNFSFNHANKAECIENHKEEIAHFSRLLSLRHSAFLLLDETRFHINFLVDLDSFLVSIEGDLLQVDPVVFYMNGTFFINYELIDYQSGQPFDRNRIGGVRKNYNIIPVDKIRYFDNDGFADENRKISDIIFENVSTCFCDLTKQKYRNEDYSYLHNTLVITQKGIDIEQYLSKAIGSQLPNLNLQDLSGIEGFRYYSHDSFGIIELSTNSFRQQALYDGLLLESVKMYLCQQTVAGVQNIDNFEMLLHHNDYIESLQYLSHVPIITENAIKAFTSTNSFIHYKSELELKIRYYSRLAENKKSNSSRLLNILLYLLAVISSIGALDALQSQIGVSFKAGLIADILIFGALGIYWYMKDRKK